MAASLHYPSLRASHATLEREGRRLSALRWLLRLCALGLAAELVYVVLASPRFAIRTVELRGDENLCAQLAGADGRGDSGPAGHLAACLRMPANTNYFLAPTRRLARRLASLPAVRAAWVERDFPDRLVVTVERREPAAVIRTTDQALLVDAQGVVYTISNEWGWGLPELVAPHLPGANGGGEALEALTAGKAGTELRALLAALRVLDLYPHLGVTRLELDGEGEVSVLLRSGAEVRLGTPDQLPVKIRLLAAALRQLGADRIASVDVSDPTGAYWRPRQVAGAVTPEAR